jgi:two-component system alkaline phosphatase synthesis response regulator PhoP
MARIIVVEDDIGQREELLFLLAHAGHEVCGAGSGDELDACLAKAAPDVVLLDYNLPGEPGIELAAKLRKRFGLGVGLVMVTARSLSVDRVECRKAGVDDYLIKPVDIDELLALIDNLSSRLNAAAPAEDVWQLLIGSSELLPPGAEPVRLTAWEMLLMQALAKNTNRQADRDTLIRALGKNPIAYDPRALEANISRLRRKLPPLPDGRNPLQAMRGIGYQFICPLTLVG